MVDEPIGATPIRDPATHRISRRATGLISSHPMPDYIREHFSRVDDRWDAIDNRDGYIALCIAENKLVWDLLEPRLAACRAVPRRVLEYDSMTGSLSFREQLARFMGRSFLGRTFAADNIAVLAGAGTVLEVLFYALGDPGDGVLVPTPSYAGFWADLETRDELRIVPVHCASEDGFRLTEERLDAALAGSDRPIKALLFTTPNNPLGTVYTAAEIEAVIGWGEERGIHVVIDEIYALSVFGETPFVSAASLRPKLGELVHIVWAFSKDFAASGLRCGVLVSENEGVLGAVDGLAYWACCSGDTQFLLGTMVSDEAWVDRFVAQNQRRLREANRDVAEALDNAAIAHIAADAGFFVVCDMRPFMDEITWAAEDALWRRLLEEAKVNLTPGAACRIGEPGFMRLCYAGVPTEAAVEGVNRIGTLLRSASRSGRV